MSKGYTQMTLILTVLLALSIAATPLQPEDYGNYSSLAPYYARAGSNFVPNDYIVVLSDNDTVDDHFRRIGTNISAVAAGFYSYRLVPAYRASLNESMIHDLIRKDPGVEFVERNVKAPLTKPVEYAREDIGNTTLSGQENDASNAASTKPERRWMDVADNTAQFALAMLSAKTKLSPTQGDTGPFWFGDFAGRGVDIYIFDTGVNIDHPVFQGRARNFRDLSLTDTSPYTNDIMNDTSDNGGHGTCVATLAGGARTGTARHANIINVKVMSQEGVDYGDLGIAMDDVAAAHALKQQQTRGFKGSVINMSFGADLDDVSTKSYVAKAISAAKSRGIFVVASAGNANIPARDHIPCNAADAVCVGAVDKYYNKASFSNYGTQITLSAPGQSIKCGTSGGDYEYMSGTSMAAPLVTGIVAYFMSYEGPTSWNSIYARLLSNMQVGYLGLDLSQGTPNNFANNGYWNPKKPDFLPYFGAPWAYTQPAMKAEFVNDASNTSSAPGVNTLGSRSSTTTITDPPITATEPSGGDLESEPSSFFGNPSTAPIPTTLGESIDYSSSTTIVDAGNTILWPVGEGLPPYASTIDTPAFTPAYSSSSIDTPTEFPSESPTESPTGSPTEAPNVSLVSAACPGGPDGGGASACITVA
ncbi:MAG: Suppressor of the cold-sensitive snRNP biogenesis mutant brr1-1 [Bogoriella megaspora]|nr:MAG: Suppressor of the cold-sensitive snRNP biogenesis mutant brr1-1 [Bogoriella megaspora]